MAERVSVIDVCAVLLPTQCLHTLSFLLINVHYYYYYYYYYYFVRLASRRVYQLSTDGSRYVLVGWLVKRV